LNKQGAIISAYARFFISRNLHGRGLVCRHPAVRNLPQSAPAKPQQMLEAMKGVALTLEDNFGKKKNEKERNYIIM